MSVCVLLWAQSRIRPPLCLIGRRALVVRLLCRLASRILQRWCGDGADMPARLLLRHLSAHRAIPFPYLPIGPSGLVTKRY